jgi:putative tryptophan/tyrosine transport system substrate-binding protein
MRRRDLVALLGSTAIAWPLVARAQKPSQMRRIGFLSLLAETDSEAQVDDAAFRKRLTDLGWTDGRNIRIDCRWGAGNVGRVQMFAKELVGLNPDVLVSLFTPSTAALQSEPKPFRLFLRWCPIPSVVDSSPALQGRVGTSPGSLT